MPEQSTPKEVAARRYWRINLGLTLALTALWAVISFGAGYFAAELNAYRFLGFPLGFYTFAQGAMILYLVIIGVYVLFMDRLDRRYGFDESHPPT